MEIKIVGVARSVSFKLLLFFRLIFLLLVSGLTCAENRTTYVGVVGAPEAPAVAQVRRWATAAAAPSSLGNQRPTAATPAAAATEAVVVVVVVVEVVVVVVVVQVVVVAPAAAPPAPPAAATADDVGVDLVVVLVAFVRSFVHKDRVKERDGKWD